MILNNKLETFIKVANEGSFNKASEELFLSPPAVIKQINSLESELGFQLFRRTKKGLTLTDAGKSFYEDTKYLLKYFMGSVERARMAETSERNFLRVGVSIMTPGQFVVDLWARIHTQLPQLKFQFIPFQNIPEIAREGERNFGRDIDLTVGVFDEDFLKERECAATWLSDEPLRIAVPFHHSLYSRDFLSIQDLYGQNLMLIHRHWNKHIDFLRDDLERNHPQVAIFTFDFYQVEIFNRCERENNLILTIDRWKDVHPLMKVLPVKWNHAIPFGILHSPKPSKLVGEFLVEVRRVTRKSL